MNRFLLIGTLSVLFIYPATANADPSCTLWSTDPETFFSKASAQDINRCLTAGSRIGIRYANRATPLHYAAMHNGDPSVIAAFLESGANVNAASRSKSTPLLLAASYHPTLELISLLIDADADVRSADRDGMTPLHAAAAWASDPAIITRLLEAGAVLEARTKNGMTPLHFAAMSSQHPEIVLRLIDAGANLHSKNSRGETAYDLSLNNRVLHTSSDRLETHYEKQRRAQQAARAASAARQAEQRRQQQAELKRRRKEAVRQRLAEEAQRAKEAENRRLAKEKAEAEERQREQQRLKRIEDQTTRILAQREQCTPKLEPVGTFGALLNKGAAIDSLAEHQSPYAPAYITAIPFILAGHDEYPDVYAALKDRLLAHSEHVNSFNRRSRDVPAVIDDWIASITAFMDNCLFDIADYLILYFLDPGYTFLQLALGVGHHKLADPTEIKIYSVVQLVPPKQLQYLSNTGELPPSTNFARTMAALSEQRHRHKFINGTCLTYFNEQSKL